MRPRKFYATRHTFISIALSRGARPKWVAEYVGTSVAMIEKHYGNTSRRRTATNSRCSGRSASGRFPRPKTMGERVPIATTH